MRRGQVQIFTEFLGFSLGLVVVTAIAFVFSTYLSPKLVNEALDYHLDNMIKQVEVAASQMMYYSDFFGDKTIELKLNLPTKLNKYVYELYKFNDKLCASIASTEGLKCVDNDYNIQGSYVSGTRMVLTLEKWEGQVSIRMSAD
jgi:hypothetical protein